MPMKTGIHPKIQDITVTCSCGNVIETRSTLNEDMRVDMCSKCHPFYTGQQKVHTGDRITRFRKRFGGAQAAAPAPAPSPSPTA